MSTTTWKITCCACNRTETGESVLQQDPPRDQKRRGWVHVPHTSSGLCPYCMDKILDFRGLQIGTYWSGKHGRYIGRNDPEWSEDEWKRVCGEE